MRCLLTILFLACSLPAAHAQYFDTLHIHYDIGISALQTRDKQLLDSLAGDIAGRKLLIYSYADYLGSERPNLHLSDNRALLVKNYLLKKGVDPQLIMECTGLGRVPGSGGLEGDPASRRTDIFIRRNNKTAPKVAASTAPPASGTKPVKPPARQYKMVREEEPVVEGKVTPIDVSNLKVNEVVRLENIGFYPGRDMVMPSSYAEVENLYNIMDDNPTLKIRLEGHVCCCVYPDGFFKDTPTWGLSVARAYRIYRHLIDRGIARERMEYEGFGRTRPIKEDEKNSLEGQVNRRVEVRILAK